MNKWNENDTEYLKKEFATMSNEDLARELNRSVSSITGKAFNWGLKKDKEYAAKVLLANSNKKRTTWNTADIKKLKYHISTGKTYKEIGKILQRNYLACQKKAKAIGISKYMKGGF